MAEATAPAVFFDRDGTIMKDVNYCSDAGDVRVFAFVNRALQKLKTRGYKLIMVTNQSGIGRGYLSWQEHQAVQDEVLRQLGVPIDGAYVCPDPPGTESPCRKPAPGMVLQAAQEHDVDLSRSVFIGDKETDVECGHRAGIKAIRVATGFETDTTGSTAEWVAKDFAEAAEIILVNFGR